jgi:hypothetical protein
MSKKNKYGKCRICGKESELRFEHAPPRSAINKATVVEYTVGSWSANRKEIGRRRKLHQAVEKVVLKYQYNSLW